jgi:ABC-type glycerol-3-phosphate transport system substrate-binding protein
MQEGDRLYGVPFNSFLFLLNYNKDLYAAAGISRPPETLDELLANSKKIHDPAKDTWGYLAFTKYADWLLEQLWYNEGVGYFEGSENFDKYDVARPITITKPEAIRSLEYVKQLAATAPGGIQGNIGVTNGQADAIFARGNLAHYFTIMIDTSQIEGYNPGFVHEKNWDVAVFPAGSKRRGCMFSNLVMGLSKGAKDPDAAWEFMRFLSGEYEGKLCSAIGTMPLRMDAALDMSQPASWIIPRARELFKGDVFPQSYFAQRTMFKESLVPNEEAFFLDQKTAEQALADVATTARQSINR